MQKYSTVFDSIVFYLLTGLLFFVPIFFVPSTSIPFTLGKSFFIVAVSSIAFFIWLIGRLKEGVFMFPKSWLYASALLVFVAYGLATFFSPNLGLSFFGNNLDADTFAFVAAAVAVFFLVPQIFTGEKKIFYAYAALFVSFLITAFYEIIKLSTGKFSFGVLTEATSNLVGNWNDLGIFAGLIILLAMLALDTLELTPFLQIVLYVSFILAFALLALIGFSQLWIVLALMSLVFFIYQFSFKRTIHKDRPNIAFHSLAVLLISLFFVFAGSTLSGYLDNALNVSQVEVRPSWNATVTVAGDTLHTHPLFGAGPERFASQWVLYKPSGVNGTLFWNTDFTYGIGFLPTLAVTIGLVGAAAFFVYLVLLLLTVGKAFVIEPKTNLGGYFLLSSLCASVYLWILESIYVPGQAMFFLTFVFSGILLAVFVSQEGLSMRRFSFIDKPVQSFVSVLITVLVLIAVVAFGYAVTKDSLAAVYFERATLAANDGSVDLALSRLQSANSFFPNTVYDRAEADVYLSEINTLLNSTQSDQTAQSAAVQKFQTLLASAISSAQAAVTLDPTDYANYLELGKVYGTVVSLKVTGAYDASKVAYTKAFTLNPQNPEIDYMEAELELANGSTTAAQIDINNALAKKSDYADAIFLLSQIEVSQGNVPAAINSVKSVAVLSPNDPGVFFQLGLLEYSQKDYQDAEAAFTKAVALSPQYANAKYYLGLSDYYNGDVTGAIAQFTDLSKTNSGNATIATILQNLASGKAPFSGEKATSSQSLPVSQ
ncbi:MAG TPA: tetratricopeptide repeat protein [Candidatus Paceibacterota bacterium]|nr:tetratricopeptide repeat protein [Candidatus Paceibacterota bacterium]